MDAKSKTIAYNTFFLTVRIVILTVVTFFTSRVVLDKLGIEDFGIYNVITSLAITFAFFSSSLTNATQRFITVELGKNSIDKANKVFNQHFLVYSIISLAALLIAEIVGIYVVGHKINIPTAKVFAAQCLFQFALLTVLVELLSIVFESLIIAHEDMKIYSYATLYEGFAKLLIAYIISILPTDRLITYGFLIFLASLSSKLIYVVYSFRKYEECFFHWFWDRKLIISTFKFISWNVISTAQVAVCDQGISLILNIFWGPVANAARGVSAQVTGAIFKFVNTILVAVQPQMVKSYSSGDNKFLEQLFFASSRFSYLALWIFVCPVFCSIEEILNIWLVEVPRWTVDIVRIAVLSSCIYVLSKPVWNIVIASGELKKYTLWTSLVAILQFPLSYIALKQGYSPVCVYVCGLLTTALSTIVQLRILRVYFDYSYIAYTLKVIKPLAIVSICTLIPMLYLKTVFSNTLVGVIAFCTISFSFTLLISFFGGCQKEEKQLIYNKVRLIISKI